MSENHAFTALQSNSLPPLREGVFLDFPASTKSMATYPVGLLPDILQLTCCHRFETFWMNPLASKDLESLPTEIQYLLAQLKPESQIEDDFIVLIPLIDNPVRTSLQGSPNGLELLAETGDTEVPIPNFRGLFAMTGTDPYQLLEKAAEAVAHQIPGRLRRDKPLPTFVDHFGWCTWDAFYHDVSMEKVQQGLESFKSGGIIPTYLILDDGWLSIKRDEEDNANRLISFAANEKFPGGLKATVQLAKEGYGVKQVFAWHAFTGYWGGVDPSFADYGATLETRRTSPSIFSHVGEVTWWGKKLGLVPQKHIYRFFQDFHRDLRSQGIDGVKVDVQAQIEYVSEKKGGRLPLMIAYHEALEGSVHVHFQGNLINCMSLANDMLYSAPASTLTRSSADFYPDKPETHGAHLYINSQFGAWFGQFVHPDWDMFQSGHSVGSFHAAGRAVSGGPVYVSDKPGKHDFDLLRQLVLPNGEILRASQPGLPSRDTLFHDPTKEEVLLKIFTKNPTNGLIGVFNCHQIPETNRQPILGVVKPAHVEGIEGDSFAVRSYRSGEVRVLHRNESWSIELGPLEWDLFTIVPLIDDFALFGLANMMNGGATVRSRSSEGRFHLSHGGEYIAFAETKPTLMLSTGEDVEVRFNASKRLATFTLPPGSPAEIIVS